MSGAAILARLHAIGSEAWVRFVQWLNWIALSLGGLIVAVNAMYPTAVSDAAASLPPLIKLLLLAAWAALVQYALSRARKSA